MTKDNVSKWFETLNARERKDLVCLLFDLRHDSEGKRGAVLYDEMLTVIDNEYHSLKGLP